MEATQTNESVETEQQKNAAAENEIGNNAEEAEIAPGHTEETGSAEDDAEESTEYTETAEAISKELAKINAIDPSVKSFDDILNSDTGKIFTEKVKRGYSLYDAYLVSNQKRILRSVTEAVRQSALNSVNSKSHLTGTGSSKAEQPIDVPSKTYSLYRSMFPELSDQQIKAHYAKHNKDK